MTFAVRVAIMGRSRPGVRRYPLPKTADDIVAEILGKLPSGCSILTSAHAAKASGMLTSWIQQAAMEPLLLTAAIRRQRPILELIDASGRFVLNLIAGDPKQLFGHFARGFALHEPAFEGLTRRDSAYGVILEEALGFLECTVHSKVEAGDHWVYVGRPLSGELLSSSEPYVHVRNSATTY